MRRAVSLIAALLCAAPGLAACGLPQSSYSIPSDAMIPTLEKGMTVGADQTRGVCGATQPKPGDIVIYRRDAVNYISRAIAGPGQMVALSRGRLSINGQAVATTVVGSRHLDFPSSGVQVEAKVIRETLANGASYLTLDYGPDGSLDDVPAYKVPAASWYVLGDNRDNSADSRVYGPVSAANLCAIVTTVLWAKELSRVGQKP